MVARMRSASTLCSATRMVCDPVNSRRTWYSGAEHHLLLGRQPALRQFIPGELKKGQRVAGAGGQRNIGLAAALRLASSRILSPDRR